MLQTYNVTWDELSSLDFLFRTITNDERLHGDITLERGNNIGGLFFLVPTDNGVKQQDGNDDTEIDPVTKTGSEQDSEFHDCRELAKRHKHIVVDQLTVENGSLEVAEELQEHVFFLSCEFVEASLLSSCFDFGT